MNTTKVYLFHLGPSCVRALPGTRVVTATNLLARMTRTQGKFTFWWKEVEDDRLGAAVQGDNNVYRLKYAEEGWTRCTDEELLVLRVEDRLEK